MTVMNKRSNPLAQFEENIILFLFEVNVSLGILSRSTFQFASSRYLQICMFVVIFMMFLCSLISVKVKVYDVLWLIIGSALCIATNGIFGNLFLYIVLIAYSMRNINLNKLIKWTILSISLTLLVIITFSLLGLIPNLSFVRNGIYRNSMGMRFPLLFGAYIFILCALLTIRYGQKAPLKMIIFLIIMAIIINRVANAKNDSICILMLVLVIVSSGVSTSTLKKFCVIMANILFVFSFCIPFITSLIPYGTPLYFLMDKLTTGRFYYQNILLSYYSPKLFGQNIVQNGLGGSNGNVNNYFYIDSSITRIMFMGGILFFILFMYALKRSVSNFAKHNLYIIAMVIIVVWINGFFEDSLSNPTTSIFIVFLLVSNFSMDVPKENSNNKNKFD